MRRTAVTLIVMASLAACARSDDVVEQESGTETAATAEAENVEDTAPEPEPATPTDADLSAYVGKYPFDKLNDLGFTEQPLVKAAVEAAVADPDLRSWVLGEKGGPSAPIELRDGKLVSWACEQHNCGPHQWAIHIDPAGTAADVCYQDEDALPGKARWFRAGAEAETRGGGCQLPEAG